MEAMLTFKTTKSFEEINNACLFFLGKLDAFIGECIMSNKITFTSNLISRHVHCFAEVHSNAWSSGGW